MIYDECGAVGGMRIGRGNGVLGENLPQRHFKFHMTRPKIEPGPPRWKIKRLNWSNACYHSVSDIKGGIHTEGV
jgi:hypothetical protein